MGGGGRRWGGGGGRKGRRGRVAEAVHPHRRDDVAVPGVRADEVLVLVDRVLELGGADVVVRAGLVGFLGFLGWFWLRLLLGRGLVVDLHLLPVRADQADELEPLVLGGGRVAQQAVDGVGREEVAVELELLAARPVDARDGADGVVGAAGVRAVELLPQVVLGSLAAAQLDEGGGCLFVDVDEVRPVLELRGDRERLPAHWVQALGGRAAALLCGVDGLRLLGLGG